MPILPFELGFATPPVFQITVEDVGSVIKFNQEANEREGGHSVPEEAVEFFRVGLLGSD